MDGNIKSNALNLIRKVSCLPSQKMDIESVTADIASVDGKVTDANAKLDEVVSELPMFEELRENLEELGLQVYTLSGKVDDLETTLVDEILLTEGTLSSLIAGSQAALSAEHQALKTEILDAVNAQSGSSGSIPQITETTTVEWFGPETTVWNPTDGWGYTTNTLNIGSKPKRVSLWIFGKAVDSNGDSQVWEHNDGTATKLDSFSVRISINGVMWERIPLSTGTRDGYNSYAFNPIDDIPMSGEITLEYRRAMSDTRKNDDDPFVITWYVEG